MRIAKCGLSVQPTIAGGQLRQNTRLTTANATDKHRIEIRNSKFYLRRPPAMAGTIIIVSPSLTGVSGPLP